MFVAPNGDVDLPGLLAGVGRYLARVRLLIDNPDFDGWRHEQEPGALLRVLLDARARCEAARLHDPERRARELRLVANSLPKARLEQLMVSIRNGDEAA